MDFQLTANKQRLWDFLNIAFDTVKTISKASIKKEAERLYREAGLTPIPFLDKHEVYKKYFG